MFTQAVADEICAKLEQGQSLRAVCRDPELPSASTVLAWLQQPDKKAFAEQYAQARARQYALLADQMMDELEGVGSPMDVPAARLRFDARRWMLSKMLPKVYGEKLETVHSGSVTVEKIRRTVIDPAA